MLTLNGGTGADTFTLNNPATPTNLTGINVTGDPITGTVGGNDTLVLNGRVGAADAFSVQPNGLGAGKVLNGITPAVSYANIITIQVAGQSADGDNLDVEGSSGNDLFTYTPGTTGDTGTITGTLAPATGAYDMPAVSFSGMTGGGAVGGVNFENVAASGGSDTLIYNGTPADNAITLSGTTPVTLRDVVGGQAFSTVVAAGLANLVITWRGSNSATIPGGITPAVTVQGNGSPADSTLNFIAVTSALSLTTVDFNAQTVVSTPTTVTFRAVGTVNVNGGGGLLQINGTGGSQNVTYTPTAAQAGTVTAAATSPTVNFTNVAGTFTLNPVAPVGATPAERDGQRHPGQRQWNRGRHRRPRRFEPRDRAGRRLEDGLAGCGRHGRVGDQRRRATTRPPFIRPRSPSWSTAAIRSAPRRATR